MENIKVFFTLLLGPWATVDVFIGTWIPLSDGRVLAERNNILDKLLPIFDFVPGDRSPPPAPKHAIASRPRGPRASTVRRRLDASMPMHDPRMGVSTFSQDQYENSAPGLEDEEIVDLDQTTLESESMLADEEMISSQHSNHARKRRRGPDGTPLMSPSEQEHILYGDQLLDYFMTVGDAPEAARVQPPVPPPNFQVNRPIDDQGNTALHWAAAMGDLEIVQDLINRGADVRALSVHEETPLVRAVLFTNNYEKKTFPALVNLLQENITFRDWFGATVFHHLAETTRSKGKWKSAKYYCEVLLQKLRDSYSREDLDMLLSCQDSNGDTPALVAARNGNFRLTHLFLLHHPESGNLVNKKGETAIGILESANSQQFIPNHPPSSVTHGNDHTDADLLESGDFDNGPSRPGASRDGVSSELQSKITAIMEEANRKLTQAYGNATVDQNNANDGTNPEALYEQLEADRRAIQKESMALSSAEKDAEPFEAQMARYEAVRQRCESLVERMQRKELAERFSSLSPETKTARRSDPPDVTELKELYHLARELTIAQKRRRATVRDLIQQKADAGVSAKLDMHRKLVALATGLKEEELDPMVGELAETLEFDRMNGKTSGPAADGQSNRVTNSTAKQNAVPVDA